jgi:hypothetical protein
MALKKPSQAAHKTSNSPDPAAVEALASALADRPYGEEPPVQSTSAPAAVVKKAKPISISLPPEVIQDLEDRVRANKLSGDGPRTVSGLIKEALKKSGYKI